MVDGSSASAGVVPVDERQDLGAGLGEVPEPVLVDEFALGRFEIPLDNKKLSSYK
jgi:hypothetical protein